MEKMMLREINNLAKVSWQNQDYMKPRSAPPPKKPHPIKWMHSTKCTEYLFCVKCHNRCISTTSALLFSSENNQEWGRVALFCIWPVTTISLARNTFHTWKNMTGWTRKLSSFSVPDTVISLLSTTCECLGSLTVKSRCKCKSRNIMENQIADSHYLPFVQIHANVLFCKQALNYSIPGLIET